jgi:hypothetical protein
MMKLEAIVNDLKRDWQRWNSLERCSVFALFGFCCLILKFVLARPV